jgi:hypothetical protein
MFEVCFEQPHLARKQLYILCEFSLILLYSALAACSLLSESPSRPKRACPTAMHA